MAIFLDAVCTDVAMDLDAALYTDAVLPPDASQTSPEIPLFLRGTVPSSNSREKTVRAIGEILPFVLAKYELAVRADSPDRQSTGA
jgi:hypothetical protein